LCRWYNPSRKLDRIGGARELRDGFMRIIAGERRGHKLEGPSGRSTRPTSDLVRESIFNILGSLVEGRVVYDLFAGTGAMGLEALSRGASKSYFLETDRQNVAVIRRNIAHLRYEAFTHIYQADALRWMRGYAAVDDQPVLVLIDPPYRDHGARGQKLETALSELIARLPRGSVVVVEAPEKFEPGLFPKSETWDVRKYGGTAIALCIVGEAQAEPTSADICEDALRPPLGA
jgi:16S rRNA (guanine966-N2)-methyltransferase